MMPATKILKKIEKSRGFAPAREPVDVVDKMDNGDTADACCWLLCVRASATSNTLNLYASNSTLNIFSHKIECKSESERRYNLLVAWANYEACFVVKRDGGGGGGGGSHALQLSVPYKQRIINEESGREKNRVHSSERPAERYTYKRRAKT